MRKWRLSSQCFKRIVDAVRASCNCINYEFLTNFADYSAARKLLDSFFRNRPDVQLIGLCTNDKGFLENAMIQRVSPLPSHAVLLGWDLYEYGDYLLKDDGSPLPPMDYNHKLVAGLGCTFWCCDVKGELPQRLGIQLNTNGMYPDALSAAKTAEIINKERLGEPCHYLPFALFRC